MSSHNAQMKFVHLCHFQTRLIVILQWMDEHWWVLSYTDSKRKSNHNCILLDKPNPVEHQPWPAVHPWFSQLPPEPQWICHGLSTSATGHSSLRLRNPSHEEHDKPSTHPLCLSTWWSCPQQHSSNFHSSPHQALLSLPKPSFVGPCECIYSRANYNWVF